MLADRFFFSFFFVSKLKQMNRGVFSIAINYLDIISEARKMTKLFKVTLKNCSFAHFLQLPIRPQLIIQHKIKKKGNSYFTVATLE